MVRNLTLEDVRPIIGNLSRANYYQVQFGGLSSGLTNYLGNREVNSRFIAEDFGLMCKSASIPGSSLGDIQSANYHGVTENFAYQKIFTEISLEFYCDNEYKGLKFLEHWMEYAVSGNRSSTATPLYASPQYNYRMRYPNDRISGYKSQSTRIFKFEPNYQQLLEYTFIGMFPKSLQSTPVRYGPNNELTQISCSFAYDRYIAGRTYSFDYVLGNANNVFSVVDRGLDIINQGVDTFNRGRDFINSLSSGDGIGVFNSLVN